MTTANDEKRCIRNENGKRIRGHVPKHVENYEAELPEGVFALPYRWTLGGMVRRMRAMRAPVKGRVYRG